MVAMLLAPGTHQLGNVPGILDVTLMGQVLEHIGATCTFGGHGLTVEVPSELRPEAPLDLVRQMRASIVVLGPLLARERVARVAFPGGDDLGARPIDMHIDGLRKMGAEFELEHGVLMATAPGGLVGTEIGLEFPSVGATENILLGAVLAKGTTTVHNAAREPEIEDLAAFLVKMGARIQGAGTSTVIVEGVDELQPVSYDVLP